MTLKPRSKPGKEAHARQPFWTKQLSALPLVAERMKGSQSGSPRKRNVGGGRGKRFISLQIFLARLSLLERGGCLLQPSPYATPPRFASLTRIFRLISVPISMPTDLAEGFSPHSSRSQLGPNPIRLKAGRRRHRERMRKRGRKKRRDETQTGLRWQRLLLVARR